MKLLLFDIDGTLLISKGLGREAKSRTMLQLYGTDAHVRTHPFGGKTDWQILLELLEPHGWTSAQIGARMPEYEQVFAQHMAELAPQFPATPLPGAQALVQTMHERADVTVGLVTGNTSATAPVKLRAGGFDPTWFVVGAYGNESHNRNDLPRIALQRAIDHAAEPIALSDCLILGDTLADVACARAAGMPVAVVLTGFEAPADLLASQPDYVLDDLTQFSAKVPF